MTDWLSTALALWEAWGTFSLLCAAGLLVLLLATPGAASVREGVRAVWTKLFPGTDPRHLDWKPLFVFAAVWFGAITVYGLLHGQYGCHPPGVSDPIGQLNQGRALWAGTDPFNVSDCGTTIEVPYGLAAVLLDALGSLGGLPGIFLVWGAVGLALLPLTSLLAERNRPYILLFLLASPLFVPTIAYQIDGATNAIVPATVLLALYLARRNERLAAAVGGFLSTARFPNLLPILSLSGSARRRPVLVFFAGLATFAAVTLLSFALWGGNFFETVFTNQLTRRSFSLNLYGPLLFHNALPSSFGVELLQATLTVALVAACCLYVRSPVRAVAITLVGFALLTPFLSVNILIWLVPVVLAGARARWWLWGVGVVGSLNYGLALNVWAWNDGVVWPSEVMDVVLTALLLALFIDLWRAERREEPADGDLRPIAPLPGAGRPSADMGRDGFEPSTSAL